MDAEIAEGFRWIEVAPPASAVSVAIVAGVRRAAAGIDTGIRFVSTDADAEHGSMAAAASTSTRCALAGVPPMFSFRDLDGNTYYLAEPDE